MTSRIRFEEPAHDAYRQSVAAFTAALRNKPGQWALFGKYTTAGSMRQGAYEIRHGIRPHFQGGGFQAEARTMLGEFRVYARYVGEVTS